MIKCKKCGKLYDYGKYEGICPKCARYNRPDSRAEMEQDLHERYDSNPNMHAAQKERYSGNENYRNRSYENRNSETGKKGVKMAAVLVAIICAAVIVGGIAVGFFQRQITSVVNDLTIWGDNTFDNEDEDTVWSEDDTWYTDDDIIVNRREEIYVSYAWSDYLGTDLGEVDWDSVYVEISEDEKQELAALLPEEGYTYYVVTLEIQNDLKDSYDLSTADSPNFWLDEDESKEPGSYIPCIKIFSNSYPVIMPGDFGYIDCLVEVPEDTDCLYGSCVLDDRENVFDCDMYVD